VDKTGPPRFVAAAVHVVVFIPMEIGSSALYETQSGMCALPWPGLPRRAMP